MVTKNTSVYKEMANRPIFKITDIFLKCLLKIPVQPSIFRNSKGLLFFLIDRSCTPHSNCNLVKGAFKRNFGVKSNDFWFSTQNHSSKSILRQKIRYKVLY